MLTQAEEIRTREKAYVPEHIVSLMALLSGGDPFLIDDHLCFSRDSWLILVGYPLDRNYDQARCERVVQQAVETFRPEHLRFIGPEIPLFLRDQCSDRQTDQYYVLDISPLRQKPSLLRMVRQASKSLTVERGRSMTRQHEALISELLGREELPERIRELYLAMPGYVGRSSTAWTLDALDESGRLCAFYVVELGATDFSTYLLGSHSKINYVAHASDLLFLEMASLTREHGKNSINLGLGVHEGIRRFKEKWGGKPFLTYESCECRYGAARKASLIDVLMGRFPYP